MNIIGERTVKPGRVYLAECLLEEKSAKETMALPLFNVIVTHQIKDLTANFKTDLFCGTALLP